MTGEAPMRRTCANVWALAAVLYAAVLAPDRGVAEVSDASAIRVLSFNIRVGTARDGENAWPNRRELVFEVLRQKQWDFVGLQEALRFQLDEIHQAVDGFGEVGVGRDDGERRGEYSAIFYRKDRWFAQQSGTFWLSDTPFVPGSKSWGNQIPRIVTWARFLDRKSRRPVWVFNTHFDHQSQASREKSARLLLDHIVRKAEGEPVIVTGDFNAGEDNPAMQYLLSADRGANVRLRDTFRVLHPKARNVGTFHGFTGHTQGEKIDYVLVTEHFEVLQADIVRYARKGKYPSDHFPVMAVLRLVK